MSSCNTTTKAIPLNTSMSIWWDFGFEASELGVRRDTEKDDNFTLLFSLTFSLVSASLGLFMQGSIRGDICIGGFCAFDLVIVPNLGGITKSWLRSGFRNVFPHKKFLVGKKKSTKALKHQNKAKNLGIYGQQLQDCCLYTQKKIYNIEKHVIFCLLEVLYQAYVGGHKNSPFRTKN